MPDYNGPYVYLTTHEFKSNIAYWTRMLQNKTYDAILVKRHETPVAVYLTYGVDMFDKKAKEYRTRKESKSQPTH